MAIDLPVFFDQSGKRQRRAKSLGLALGIFVFIVAAVFLILTMRQVPVEHPGIGEQKVSSPYKPETRSPAELAYSIDENLPVIGRGFLLRIVRVHSLANKKQAVDVYTGGITKTLDQDESQRVGDSKYAVERYGATDGRRIILTFDDGPHPIYTPQILDLLSKESAHASFFPIGANVVKYPEISRRIVREGHDIANHTFNHADLDLVSETEAEQEINQTQRVIRATTGTNPALFRIPYGGNDDASVQDDRRAILQAQSMGYAVASYDVDTQDWGFGLNLADMKLPELDGDDKVFLLHDAGGNRTQTVEYLRALIPKAKAAGYEFTSWSRLYTQHQLKQSVEPTVADKATTSFATATIVWPKNILHTLFFVSITLIMVSVVLSIILAEMQMALMKTPRPRDFNPLVSVIIPAYNEVKVLRKTVESIMKSTYNNLEIIIIDDGSADGTWGVIQSLIAQNPSIVGIWQRNAGKSAAVNRGLKESRGEIIVSIDADTVFAPETIRRLIRYFCYPKVGAVAGVVKVGNVKNWVTRWQALEYITSVNIERAAQSFIRSITVAPGACSAWRKEAVIKAGGYSSATLAEDCDLTLAVRKAGYDIVQDMKAVAYTESPENLRGLAKQRFRWLFGNIQAFWKHRDMIFRRRYGWLGIYVIPKAILSIIMQLLFAPLLLFAAFGNLLAGEVALMALYVLLTNIVLAVTAAVALLFARERFSYLTAAPALRFVYGPLRTILIYASVFIAIGGLELGWNKVARTGTILDIK